MARPLDALPLFASDAEIGAALLGAKRAKEFAERAPLLERRGLPKIDPMMGGRYVPAVKAFFDREHGLTATPQPLAVDGREDLSRWQGGAKRRG